MFLWSLQTLGFISEKNSLWKWTQGRLSFGLWAFVLTRRLRVDTQIKKTTITIDYSIISDLFDSVGVPYHHRVSEGFSAALRRFRKVQVHHSSFSETKEHIQRHLRVWGSLYCPTHSRSGDRQEDLETSWLWSYCDWGPVDDVVPEFWPVNGGLIGSRLLQGGRMLIIKRPQVAKFMFIWAARRKFFPVTQQSKFKTLSSRYRNGVY